MPVRPRHGIDKRYKLRTLPGMTERKESRLEVRLPPSLLAQLDEAAKSLGVSRGFIARIALEHWLATKHKEALRALAGDG